MEKTDYLNWSKDDMIQVINYVSQFPNQESYERKICRLAKLYPSVAAAKAHLDELVALVAHGE